MSKTHSEDPNTEAESPEPPDNRELPLMTARLQAVDIKETSKDVQNKLPSEIIKKLTKKKLVKEDLQHKVSKTPTAGQAYPVPGSSASGEGSAQVSKSASRKI